MREFLGTLPLDLEGSVARVMSKVDAFRGDTPIEDDQSLLAVELGD